ncbi:hypothetical protein [Nitrosomonas mobilis]|uniref:hypothetical protein n=1 Tax=Nitrosomonas mobilis TaxID=51642 RepID=UPI001C409C88|nr:hypothetical protein [Nitrosomonas mobilis]HNO76365.1 hypothetical protein [Nitrosomonas mobilis]
MQTFYFHPEVARDMRESVVWYEQQAKGLFELYFQPIVNTATANCVLWKRFCAGTISLWAWLCQVPLFRWLKKPGLSTP